MAQLTIALDGNDIIKFVGEVAKGGDCGCFCPACRSPLVAKKGRINEWHFAHESGQEHPECLVGALNLFSRLLIEHLQAAGAGIAVQGLAEVIVSAVRPSSQGATVGLAELSDGRQIAVYACVEEQRRYLDVGDGADHLLYSCQTPTPEVLTDRQSANYFITRYARLQWRGAESRVDPQRERRSASPAVKKLALAQGIGAPIMVYPLKDGSDWIMYKNSDGCFVLRQWPVPGEGWEIRFPPNVGVANLDAGAYEVKDFLNASASLRPLARKSGLQCHSLDSVQRVLVIVK
ncbi:MAG: competence protein CoiA family protein [Polaromonas sp.]|uniref:competence protein CoiA family protein n=1 Tax=Polaromonas sp. TaxID=1869339 RepID=UPI002487DEC0|nr:competence protein CoiA family protein [Polaromonas sp.]MDI1240007.1 competence protein CoiA family protein [Polaromonas sp.]